MFVSQGNLSYIYSKLIAAVVGNIPSLEPTNFVFNKKVIDECVEREVIRKSTKFVDEHIQEVMEFNAECLDFSIDNVPKYTAKQVKTVYLCSDKKDLIEKLQHIDISKIVTIEKSSRYYELARSGGCIIELNYAREELFEPGEDSGEEKKEFEFGDDDFI